MIALNVNRTDDEMEEAYVYGNNFLIYAKRTSLDIMEIEKRTKKLVHKKKKKKNCHINNNSKNCRI